MSGNRKRPRPPVEIGPLPSVAGKRRRTLSLERELRVREKRVREEEERLKREKERILR